VVAAALVVARDLDFSDVVRLVEPRMRAKGALNGDWAMHRSRASTAARAISFCVPARSAVPAKLYKSTNCPSSPRQTDPYRAEGELATREQSAVTRKLTFLIVLLVSSIALAPISIAQTVTNGADLKKAVTFIFPPDSHGNLRRDPKTNNPMPYGTGFFVGVKNDIGKLIYGYLVTAKHVLKDENGNDFARVFLRLDLLKVDAAFIPIDLIQSGHRVVYTHPDPSVDIAVVPMLPSQSLFDFKILPDDMLSTKAI